MISRLHSTFRTAFAASLLAAALPLAALPLIADAQSQSPKSIVEAAVKVELDANRNDHTAYIYRDHDTTGDHDTLFLVVETPQGSLKRKLEDHGKPISADERHIDDLRVHALLNDINAQQKAKRDANHDDQQAEEMLKLLPTAFLWTITREQGDLITLNFEPDPAFTPHTLEARVLSAMAGQIVVARSEDRIRTIRGTLTDDVKFGFGILGRLRKGGTFEVERREVVPHHWEVTESRVHMEGHALLFKTIGQQEDELKTSFRPSPALTLQQAYDILEPVSTRPPLCCKKP